MTILGDRPRVAADRRLRIQRPVRVQCRRPCTNANFNAKSFVLILFVNQRLVECGAVRRTIDSVYSAFLPRGAHPFVYLAVTVPVRRRPRLDLDLFAPDHTDPRILPSP